ncbi:MAG: carboxylating nicotinate-nucleotide diphosphorylase [Elusimicrobiota bacterium]
MKKDKLNLKKLVKEALLEDEASKDITSLNLEYSSASLKAFIISRQKGILCGLPLVKEVYKQISSGINVKFNLQEGAVLQKGSRIADIEGPPAGILAGERTALNFLSHMCSIATATARYVQNSGKAEVYDTRKTLPGLRDIQKYAVRVGGGKNHRRDLSELALIKENHIRASKEKDPGKIVEQIKTRLPLKVKIEVEVETLDQLQSVLNSPADIVMLDNFSPEEVKKAVLMAEKKKSDIIIEVSGGINLNNIHKYALRGVDRISSGSITSSCGAFDLSLLADE